MDTITGANGDDIILGDGYEGINWWKVYGTAPRPNELYQNGAHGDLTGRYNGEADIIDAGEGNDWIDGGAGDDSIDAGEGDNSVRGVSARM